MAARISAHGVRLSLGGRPILDGIDLDFAPGRVHGILGPNGCGKTTLIRTLSGALRPDEGEVRLDEAPIRALSPRGPGPGDGGRVAGRPS